jgi:hypothetical protein
MPPSAKHSKQTIAQGIHTPFSFEYADQAAREAAIGFTDEDADKLAIQRDDNTVWLLVYHDPITWERVTVTVAGVEAMIEAKLAEIFDLVGAEDGDVLIYDAAEGKWVRDSQHPTTVVMTNPKE